MKLIAGLFIVMLSWSSLGWTAKETVYNLRLHYMNLNRAGVDKPKSIGINGSSPGPTLRFQKGDLAIINVKNDLPEDTSIHWHGLLVPWNMDGPSFTNNFILKPGQTQQFKFEIKQTGTYWYHSHTMFQEQIGLNGAIVVEDDHHRFHGDHDLVMVLGDWTNEDPMQVLKNLKMDGDYYNLKKKFFPSIWDAIRRAEFWDYLKNEWIKMGPMDLSDVGYDAFLINGKRVEKHPDIKPGDLVRMRFINAGASSYFYVNIGNMRPFTVITKDGLEVEPVEVNELLMGMGETYDVLFEVPDEGHSMGFEVRATSMDTTGWGSSILGDGEHIEQPPTKVRPSPYKMGHAGHGNQNGENPPTQPGNPPEHPPGHGGHGDHQMNHSMSMNMDEQGDHGGHGDHGKTDPVGKANRLDYSMLRSVESTEFDSKLKRRNIKIKLTGNMSRYVWYMNDKLFSDEKYIDIKKDEVVRVTLDNQSMMHHPMHLHGHFFRVLNGQGDHSPNFHTVDIAPGQQLIFEFWANEPGIWFFHCHNLYHMEMGMARLFRYEGFKLPKEMTDAEKAHVHSGSMVDDKTLIPSGEAKLYSNHAELNARLNGGNWDITMKVEVDKYKAENVEANVLFRRYLSTFLAVVAGAEYEDKNMAAVLGLAYRLPMIVDLTSYVRSDGKVVLILKKQIPIVNRLSLEVTPRVSYGGKEGFEYQLENELTYRVSNNVKVGVFQKYSDKLGNTVGAGISVMFN